MNRKTTINATVETYHKDIVDRMAKDADVTRSHVIRYLIEANAQKRLVREGVDFRFIRNKD